MGNARADTRRWQIGDLVLDRGTREVFRGDQVVRLPKLSYRLLIALADAAPDVVTHDKLCEQVWKGRIVGPESLSQRVKLVRRALDDHADSPKYIAAVRGVGYRLLPAVVPLVDGTGDGRPDAAVPDRVRSTRSVNRTVIAAVVVLVLAGTVALLRDSPLDMFEFGRVEAIAVLPFTDAGGRPGDRYLSDGLSRAVHKQLSITRGLRVSALASSRQFEGSDADISRIAEDLRVRRIVSGTLQRSGSELQVTARVLDGKTGRTLWSAEYVEDVINNFGLQENVARDIATFLAPGYGNEAPAQTEVSSSAYDLVLLGDHRFEEVRDRPRVDFDKLAEAIGLYRKATSADPDSAVAQSRLAAALLYAGNPEAAEGPISKARSLDANLSEVQLTLGLYLWQRQLDGVGDAYARAIELDPNNVEALSAYAIWTWSQGDWVAAEPLYEKAMQLDPLSISRYLDIGNFYGIGGYKEEALGIIQMIEERFDTADAWLVIARIYETIGEFSAAIRAAAKARQIDPDNDEPNWKIAELYARLGDENGARQYEPEPGIATLYFSRRYEEMIDLANALLLQNEGQDLVRFALARAYAASDNYRMAVYVLEKLNLPESVYSDSRRSNTVEALVTYSDVLNQLGQTHRAQEMARWIEVFTQNTVDLNPNVSWWANLYLACAQSILGKDDIALSNLESILESPGLPWYPVVMDQPCFRKYGENPRYRHVVEALEMRRKNLRDELPAALAMTDGQPAKTR